ncbi:MAG: hypothetical protein JXA13_11320 [Anaerolineales bacterium]|nr:hypothetical protein [Anaerolineales bacterium]
MPKKTNDRGIMDYLDSLETRLAGTLKPVTPSNDFVQGLRGRIRLPKRGELVSRLRDWHLVVIVVGVVASATLLIVTVARAFYALFGKRIEDTERI